MEYHRKQAKALVRAFRAGEREAVERAEAVLGERARERFQLSDAQHVVAREQGYPAWPELLRVEDREETVVETGVRYGDGEPVRVRVRRRGHRYTIDDDGAAVAKAGRPPGWLEVVRPIVEDDYWVNVNRRGVVFVPTVRKAPPALVDRIAECSAAVYDRLVDLAE
jgi:hypothetical protein